MSHSGRGSGILFILLGSTLYTYVKDRESRALSAPLIKPAPIITNRSLYSLPPMQQARAYQHPGQSHAHHQPQPRYDDEPTASTSAHNSPVLASSANGMFAGPAARLGVLNVGLANSSARDGAANGAGSGLPSPRTPRQQVGAQQHAHLGPGPGHGTYAVETTGADADVRAGAAGNGPTGIRLSPSNQTPSRRLSYDGRRTDSGYSHGLYSPHQSPQKASTMAAGAGLQQSHSHSHAQSPHGKSTSLSDLRDLKEILTGQSHHPRGVGKEEKAF